MKKFKRLAVITLALLVIMSSMGSVYAGSITVDGGSSSTPALLNQAQTTFNITVPTSIVINVSANGTVTCATSAKISNNGFGPVKITGININTLNGWSLAEYSTDFKKQKVGLKKIGIKLFESNVPVDGIVDVSTIPNINGGGSIILPYLANVSTQSSAVNTSMANIVFTVAWAEDESGGTEDHSSYFNIDEFGTITSFSDEYLALGASAPKDLVVPQVIDGINVVGVEGVIMEHYTSMVGAIVNVEPGSVNYYKLANTEDNSSISVPTDHALLLEREFNEWKDLVSVTLKDGLEVIPESSFEGCIKLNSIDIPLSVNTIGVNAFAGFTSSQTINLIGRTSTTGMTLGNNWKGNATIVYK